MKKISSIITIIVMVLTTSLLASATEKPVWKEMNIPAGFEEVATAHAIKIVTPLDRYDCSVISLKNGVIGIFAIDNYYRSKNVMEYIHIIKGKEITLTVPASQDKGEIVKHGRTYPIFKEKFLKEIHGLPWKIRKEILDAFPTPKK